MKERILVTGSCGQVGTELVLSLREKYGDDAVVATDIKEAQPGQLGDGPFETFNVLNIEELAQLHSKYGFTQIYHLAAMLSATAEKFPIKGWELNMESLLKLLEWSRHNGIQRIFWPSSIAVFGPRTPKVNTPQNTVMDPSTVYGISKLAGERWCEYYWKKYQLDVRSVRYPGLISYKTLPGGGTTDYAVDIFYKAIEEGTYTSFLDKNTTLPMMYMEDAIKATIDITEADPNLIKERSSYNIAAFSFNPEELAEKIQKHIPDFKIDYSPDFRQQIAEGWPQVIDDQTARNDWNWKPAFSLDLMVEDMLKNVKAKLQKA